MWKFARWIILPVGLAVLAFLAFRMPALQQTISRRVIESRLVEQRDALFEPNALRVLLCGTASPLPHPTRASACTAVFAGGRVWIVDAGPRSANRLGLIGLDAGRIGTVLLTHFHSDHIGDLGELNFQSWASGRPAPLEVYGPPGVERVVAGFNEAYALDSAYRTAHHTPEFMPPELAVMAPIAIEEPKYGEGPRTVFEQESLTITAFPVRHDPVRPAYGYRFDYRGRSVVISGDTAKSPSLIAAAQGADLLIHEAQANHLVKTVGEIANKVDRPRVARIMEDILDYHTTPIEAAQSANEAGVQLLVMTHLNPPPPNRFAEGVFSQGVEEVREESGWLLGEDGMLITLPADSETIEVSQL